MPETPADTITACEFVLREELVALWDDLSSAIRHAVNGQWSIQCDNLAWRMEQITRLVGPCPHDRIQMPLLLDGTYERLHAEWGVPHDPFDRAEVQATWDRYEERQRETLERLRR